MPGRLNGVQVRAIAHSRGIPTLLMTGWTDQAGQLGITGKPILAKPFTAEELQVRSRRRWSSGPSSSPKETTEAWVCVWRASWLVWRKLGPREEGFPVDPGTVRHLVDRF